MSIPNFPKQKVTRAEKGEEFGKQSVDALIEAAFATPVAEYQKYYDAYNGVLDPREYEYVADPYKTGNTKKYRYPAKIRNYNIIRPVIDLLLGEKAKRPLNYMVVVKNADSVTQKEEAFAQELIQNVKQHFINALNEAGMDTGVPSEEVEMPEELKKQFDANYRDARAVLGQEALDYLVSALEIPDQFMTAFFDWLVTGTVVTYKSIDHEEPFYEVVNPMEVYYPDIPGVRFIEDLPYVVRKTQMTVNEIVDKFYDFLKSDQIDYLESPGSGYSVGTVDGFFLNRANGINALPGELIDVFHCVWKSFKKEGILTYTDEITGTIEQMRVSDIYKVNKEAGESVEWFWVNEVWEGYRIDKDIYVAIDAIAEQRNTMNNPSICKLPYNGRVYSNRNSDAVSVVSLGLPYQVLYNVFHYRLELSIAKNKDKIALMEINTIPKRHGWDEEKFMYHADANGFAFIDSTAEGKNNERVTFNNFQVLDMSLGQYISAQFDLLAAVKMEWEEMLGVSRQRKGDIMASDGQGTTERAVYQSSVMTEDMFRKFETVEQRDLQGLIDLSQLAWSDGKKASFVTSDYRQAFLDINPELYCNADYGVFITKSSVEQEKLRALKTLALEFAQNQARPSTIAEILDSNNFSKIKAKLAEVDRVQQEYEAQQAEADRAAQEKLEQMRIEQREDEQAFEASENELDRIHKERLELMKSSKQGDTNGDGVIDANDQANRTLEREKHYNELAEAKAARMQELNFREKELKEKMKREDRKLDIAQKKIAADIVKARISKRTSPKK